MYAVCEPEHCTEVPRSIIRAWQTLANDVTDAELDEAKKRLIGKVLNTLYCMHFLKNFRFALQLFVISSMIQIIFVFFF